MGAPWSMTNRCGSQQALLRFARSDWFARRGELGFGCLDWDMSIAIPHLESEMWATHHQRREVTEA